MAHRILSIDLQSDLLTAVLLDGERNHEVLASTVVVTENRPSEEVIAELTTALDCEDCRCFLSLGASFSLSAISSCHFPTGNPSTGFFPLNLKKVLRAPLAPCSLIP